MTFFTEPSCSGTPVMQLPQGWYDQPWIPNDLISAVGVPAGLEAKLYEHAAFLGWEVVATGPVCMIMTGGFDKALSSAKIYAV